MTGRARLLPFPPRQGPHVPPFPPLLVPPPGMNMQALFQLFQAMPAQAQHARSYLRPPVQHDQVPSTPNSKVPRESEATDSAAHALLMLATPTDRKEPKEGPSPLDKRRSSPLPLSAPSVVSAFELASLGVSTERSSFLEAEAPIDADFVACALCKARRFAPSLRNERSRTFTCASLPRLEFAPLPFSSACRIPPIAHISFEFLKDVAEVPFVFVIDASLPRRLGSPATMSPARVITISDLFLAVEAAGGVDAIENRAESLSAAQFLLGAPLTTSTRAICNSYRRCFGRRDRSGTTLREFLFHVCHSRREITSLVDALSRSLSSTALRSTFLELSCSQNVMSNEPSDVTSSAAEDLDTVRSPTLSRSFLNQSDCARVGKRWRTVCGSVCARVHKSSRKKNQNSRPWREVGAASSLGWSCCSSGCSHLAASAKRHI